MSTISDRLDDVEHRLTSIEVDSAKLDARLDALVDSTNNLKWGVWALLLICILALIYGAIGRDGLFAVRDAASAVSTQNNINGGAR